MYKRLNRGIAPILIAIILIVVVGAIVMLSRGGGDSEVVTPSGDDLQDKVNDLNDLGDAQPASKDILLTTKCDNVMSASDLSIVYSGKINDFKMVEEKLDSGKSLRCLYRGGVGHEVQIEIVSLDSQPGYVKKNYPNVFITNLTAIPGALNSYIENDGMKVGYYFGASGYVMIDDRANMFVKTIKENEFMPQLIAKVKANYPEIE